MSITDATRKLLWGRSGGVCAKCKGALTEDPTEVSKALVLGIEAHIVSPAIDGPRHREMPAADFDAYDNLILLCPNDHMLVDKQLSVFTEEAVRELKAAHEVWVKQRQRSVPQVRLRDPNADKPIPAVRVGSGQQLMARFGHSHSAVTDYAEPRSDEEGRLIGDFLQNLLDWRELWGDIGPAAEIDAERELTHDLVDLEAAGFAVYVGVREKVLEGGDDGPVPWREAVVIVKRIDVPAEAAEAES
ncbi:MAG: HNH endonuclease [Actinomycetota bacterium]|nr:HNH endonuclease [Actinomycetota bacterium]